MDTAIFFTALSIRVVGRENLAFKYLIKNFLFRPPHSLESPTDVSVALLLTMAKFFRHKKYWAKDIIFVITEHEQLGMQAWLESYHKTSCGHGAKILDHGDLEARAGSIQAAINLEITHEAFTHLNVKVVGLNGQLPNLDLVTLVNRLALKEGLQPMFQGKYNILKILQSRH